MLWLSTDLPEPDSPTTASVVAGRMRKLTPLTARIAPAGVANWTCRSSTRSRSVTWSVSGDRSAIPGP